MALNLLAPGAKKLATKYALPYIKTKVLPKVGKTIFNKAIGGAKPKLNFDPEAYRNAFRKFEKDAFARSRRMSREVGSQMGQRASAGGYAGTPMSNQLITQGQQRVNQGTLDMVNAQSAELEMELAHAENMINMSGSLKERSHWTEMRDALYEALYGEILDPDEDEQELPDLDTSETEDERYALTGNAERPAPATNLTDKWKGIKSQYTTEQPELKQSEPASWENLNRKMSDDELGGLIDTFQELSTKEEPKEYDPNQPISWNNLSPEWQAITEQIGDEVSYWALQHFGPEFVDIFDFNKNVLDKVA